MMSEKVHFPTNPSDTPPPSKRLATELLAAMSSVYTALAERQLNQLLSTRSEKYEYTYNKIECSYQHRPT